MTPYQHNLRSYHRLLYPFRWQIAFLLTLSLVSACVVVIQPYLYHYAIDDVALRAGLQFGQRIVRLGYLSAIMVGCIGLAAFVNYLQAYYSAALNATTTARLRYQLLRHMLRLPLDTLVTMKAGGAAARLNQDTSALSQIVSRGLIVPASSFIQVAVAIAVAFLLNWRLSFAALVVIMTTGVLTQRFANRLRPLFHEIAVFDNELSARSTEMFAGIRVTRIYNREAAERRSYARMYHSVIRKTLAVKRKQLGIDTYTGLSFSILQTVIISLGVCLIIYRRATVGDILAIVIYANRIMIPLGALISSYHQLQGDLVSMGRVYEVLEMQPDKIKQPDVMKAPAKVMSIAFDRVSFSYIGTHRKAISDVTVTIPGETTIALVGRSGAGKSTFTDLLSRFYEPQEGTIYLNGCDTRNIDMTGYRKLLGMVQQDTFLFDGTVRDNIVYAAPKASTEDMVNAAKRANAHEFIMKLPQGYETIIGERGVRLSGGQRQRLSMARAFLVDPQILILDEATSSLDTENEQLIQKAMKELLRNRTTFIIAHRLSTITHADMIIVLDDGCIQEMGNHEELMNHRGLYFKMIEQQYGTINNLVLPVLAGV